jgi:diadenylate cyclase
VVLERETGLQDQIEAGTRLDSEVSKDLLVAIFHAQSPLHDGAVVIQQGRIGLAGAILPLTVKTELPEGVGTRHRAAVGITEETDAVVIVVSEETASISVVMNGEIVQGLDAPHLRRVLAGIVTSERRELATGESGPEEEAAGPAAEEAAEPAQARSTG